MDKWVVGILVLLVFGFVILLMHCLAKLGSQLSRQEELEELRLLQDANQENIVPLSVESE